jgi:hypothetical protein
MLLCQCSQPTVPLLGPSSAQTAGPSGIERSAGDVSLGQVVADGAVFQKKLWLVGSSGSLVFIDPANATRRTVFSDNTVAVAEADGALWVLRKVSGVHEVGQRCPERNYFVTRFMNDAQFDSGPFDVSASDCLVTFIADSDAPVVLFNSAIRRLDVDSGTWTSLKLAGDLRGAGERVATALVRGRLLYLGLDIGEFGGGVQRVDLGNGLVEGWEGGDGCARPLDSDCDPITSIIVDTQRPDCVLASVALEHMIFSRGRVVRICDDRADVIFEREYVEDEIDQTEAVYGLAPARPQGFWAVTRQGLYKVNGNSVTALPPPRWERLSTLWISRDIPGALMVYRYLWRSEPTIYPYVLMLPIAETSP